MPRAKRGVLDGFPVEKRFESRADLDEYLSGDSIQCLLCGRRFQILDTYLRAVHGITSDDYRDKYGIGRTVGLQSAPKAKKASDAALKLIKENPDRLSKITEEILKVRGRPPKGLKKPRYWREERRKYLKEDWMALGRRVAAGESITRAAKDLGITYTSLGAALRADPGLAASWGKHVAPYAVDHSGWNLTKEGRAQLDADGADSATTPEKRRNHDGVSD
jgi:hypothetical protein